MNKLILLLIALFTPTMSYSDVIDIECNVKASDKTYNEFLIKTKGTENAHVKELKNSERLVFSIDTAKESVIFPWGLKHKVLMSPEKITIFSFYTCEDDNSITTSSCSEKAYYHEIDRLTGKITGLKYAGLSLYEPYYKSDDILWSYEGECNIIKRKF